MYWLKVAVISPEELAGLDHKADLAKEGLVRGLLLIPKTPYIIRPARQLVKNFESICVDYMQSRRCR